MHQLKTPQQRREDALLCSVLFTFFASGAASQPLGSFIPFFRQAYALSYDVSGMLISFQSMGNLAAVALAGILPAYLGRRRTVLAMSVWMSVGFLIFVSGLGSPALLMLACLMTGLARGGNANFANTMVSTLPGDKVARGYNLLHGAFAVGAVLSPLLLVLLSRLLPTTGWRWVAGGLLAVSLVQLLVYARMALPPEHAPAGMGAVDCGFLKRRSFWMGAAMLFFYISTEYAICGWMVTYFQDVGILSPDQSQLMNSLYWVVVFAGRMVGAAITGKVPRTRLLLVDGVGILSCFLILFSSRTPAAVLAAMMGTGVFMATVYPTAFAFGSESVRGNDLGCSVMILTGSVGGVLTPALVGFVAERTGSIRSGMAVVLVSIILLLGSILLNAASARDRGG